MTTRHWQCICALLLAQKEVNKPQELQRAQKVRTNRHASSNVPDIRLSEASSST